MITRDWFPPAYGAGTPKRNDMPGYLVEKESPKGFSYTVAISRPVRSWAVELAGGLLRSGARLNVVLTQPHNAMDPSDPTTWQRDYRFT